MKKYYSDAVEYFKLLENNMIRSNVNLMFVLGQKKVVNRLATFNYFVVLKITFWKGVLKVPT